jgi:hypothetical protein
MRRLATVPVVLPKMACASEGYVLAQTRKQEYIRRASTEAGEYEDLYQQPGTLN